ncbi:uncharacterized protein J8A68_001022 [[Candida] subhashii]|uniref:Uncharacterized protein n=1 Tax=[Candida] subhashii TaxID=561895 RepID=A0A8J5QPT2_9ASCO|nr:uncharacterized protein J8A68_001022 [[Candida] subhashii]KAG7665334.1 hypothetical protein J8A68_001022 [[Candida] subhashii]
MSEDKELIDVDVGLDQEQSTEERLEAARRRFEELKKKKLKKHKNKAKVLGTTGRVSLDSKDSGSISIEGTPDLEGRSSVDYQLSNYESRSSVSKEGSVGTPVPVPAAGQLPISSSSPDVVEQVADITLTPPQQAVEQTPGIDVAYLNFLLISDLEIDNKNLSALTKSTTTAATPAAPITQIPVLYQPPSAPTVVKPAKPTVRSLLIRRQSVVSESFKGATEDFREKLMIWKGWQVDMTNWEGSGAQKVAI